MLAISHKHRLIFMHIPKTAGTSIVSLLKELDKDLFVRMGHPLANEWKQFREEDYRDYRWFTVCRNPYDRLVSAFFYIKNSGQNKNDKLLRDSFGLADVEFAEFVRNFDLRLLQSRPRHFVRQAEFIEGRKDKISSVLRYENLQSDLDTLFSEFGLPETRLPYKNRSERSGFSDYYGEAERRKIQQIYQLDFDVFGYETRLC